MASHYDNYAYKDYEKVCNKLDAVLDELKSERKEHKNDVKKFENTIDKFTKALEQSQKRVEELTNELLKMKSKNNRDSSNSSKPSSTNGFKKVITNRREKSDKKQGGQFFHKPHSLKNKLDQFIKSGNVEEEIIEINKTEKNKNKRYIEKVVIDIKITKVLKRYRYYPDEHGKYNIPKVHNQHVQYGPFVKGMALDLMNHLPYSTDGVTRYIEDITNKGITLSKGILILWTEELSTRMQPEIDNIETKLLESYYINHDESGVKVAGNSENILCACNDKYTRFWIHEHKSQEALREIDFLPKYKGIIVKDGTELYNPFGLLLSQCLSHILRYLKPYYEEIKHQAPKKMKEFLSKYNNIRNEKIENGDSSCNDEELNDIYIEYDNIIDEWEEELRKDIDNYLFDDEYCLFRRMKYDNKNMDKDYRGDRDEILYFLKDFKVPSTNNQAESDQRPIKIKQKNGKFRSENGANNYAVIRSCINTYKKNGTNVLDALISFFDNKGIIV